MEYLMNKLILLLCCSILIATTRQITVMVVAMLITITCSSLISFFRKNIVTLSIYVLFLILCALFPPFLYYLPLLCYDLFTEEFQIYSVFILLPLLLHYPKLKTSESIILLLLISITYLLKLHYKNSATLKRKYRELRDQTAEMNLELIQKNKELLEKQDYEIHLATLNERNRIAKEIHDSVGHLLSSSILQIGAIMATTKEEEKKEVLRHVKDTLSTGMDSIRNSIHNIYEESIDLEVKIKSLLHDFTFCKASLEYQIDQKLPLKAKYSIIFIIKEFLNNVMKHSNATEVAISLFEHPTFYQLIVCDNGNKKKSPEKAAGGMGLNSIKDRVNNMNGFINIDKESGFRIFITIPKGEPHV